MSENYTGCRLPSARIHNTYMRAHFLLQGRDMKRLSLTVFLLVSACAAGPDPTTDETALSPDEPVDLKADGADSELYVRVAESSLWVRKAVSRELRDGHDVLVVRGRTSR